MATTRLPAEQRRHQLLDVACEVFGERGFHGASMDEVAARAGVTKPVLYQHFTSKRSMFVDLLEGLGDQLIAELAAATEGVRSGRERVQAGFTAYFRFVADNEAAFRVLFGASVRNDEDFNRVVEQILDAVADVVSLLVDVEGPPERRRVVAHALIGIAEATSRDALGVDRAPLDPGQLARWVSDLAWSGLRGIPVSRRGSAPLT